MKKFIYEFEINYHYKFQVTADTSAEAKQIAIDFYNKNNYFLPKEIKSISSRVIVETSNVITGNESTN
jgi:hypothetical protein